MTPDAANRLALRFVAACFVAAAIWALAATAVGVAS